MTKVQAQKVALAIGVALTDDSDEAESLELVHLELREHDAFSDVWIIQTDWTDREDDEEVHRTYIQTIGSDGDVIESYEEH